MSFELQCANAKVFALIANYLHRAGIVDRQVFAKDVARLADDATGAEAAVLRGLGAGIALADVTLSQIQIERPI